MHRRSSNSDESGCNIEPLAEAQPSPASENRSVEDFVQEDKSFLNKSPSDSNSQPIQSVNAGANLGLNREVTGWTSIVLYCSLFIFVDFWKQLTSYGMKYYNGNIYPMPQTQLVATAEVLKFVVFFYIVMVRDGLTSLRISLWFAVPSIIYAINNNIYYYALHLTTPPVWSILIQLRVPLTALTYRVIFKRAITSVQFLALFMLVGAIAATHWSDSQTLGKGKLLPAVILAIVGSVTSVIGALVNEFLFKNDYRSFNEQQAQMYFFGTLAAWAMYSIEIMTTDNQKLHITGSKSLIYTLIVGDVLLTCLSGFIVAVIIKKLDNIVKLYSQALSNMFTSIACSIIFADHFQLNATFIVCLIVAFAAILLYEYKGQLTFASVKLFISNLNKKQVVLIVFALKLFVVVLVFTSRYFSRNVSAGVS